jgi:hypothetical protein
METIDISYERTLKDAPEKLVKNGKVQFGSFSKPPKSLDINGMKYPFGVLPLPTFITNLRIRSNLSFSFSTSEYYGTIDILDAKLFGLCEVNIWNKKTLQRYSYKNIMLLIRRLIKKDLEKGFCYTYSKRRDIKISWNKEKKYFYVYLDLKGDSVRPNFMGSFSAPYTNDIPSLTSVLPAPTKRRCYVSFQQPVSLEGGICPTRGKMNPFYLIQKTQTLFVLTKAYYKTRVLNNFISGIGKVGEDEICFRIADTSILPTDKDTYNENVLFVNNEITPLPPATVAHPFGRMKKWSIQDTESMIDLVFTPASASQRLISVFLLHAQYFTVFGTFDGVLVTKDGKSITLKDFPGIINNQRIRL